jgi:hypothetical protein
MNFLALMGLGRIIEVFLHRSHLAIVFLFSVLAGSLCSVWMMPGKTSVGASGGLMGLIGLLVIAGWRRARWLPEKFLRGVLLSVALTAGIGLVGFEFIDNAAHFGGLLCGLILGLLLLGRGGNTHPLRPGGFVRALGLISMAVVVAGAATASLKMFRGSLAAGLVASAASGAIAFGLTRLKYFDKH